MKRRPSDGGHFHSILHLFSIHSVRHRRAILLASSINFHIHCRGRSVVVILFLSVCCCVLRVCALSGWCFQCVFFSSTNIAYFYASTVRLRSFFPCDFDSACFLLLLPHYRILRFLVVSPHTITEIRGAGRQKSQLTTINSTQNVSQSAHKQTTSRRKEQNE